MSLWSRVRNVFRGAAVNRELDEEMQSHLEEAVAQGRSPEEARRAFGNLLLERERSRDTKLLPWLDSLRSDLVFGYRQLQKHRVVTIAAVLSLGLGIGACTTAFRLVDAVLFRPLPVAEPNRLFYLSYNELNTAGKPEVGESFSYPLYRELREAAKDRAELMVVSYSSRQDITYKSDAEMEKAYRQYVSGHALVTLGIKPALGRLLDPNDDRQPGQSPVAVITYQYWMRRFGGNPSVIGTKFHLGDTSYEIVGVLDKQFTGTEPGTMTDFLIPAMMNKRAIPEAGWGWMRIWARLRPGVTADQLRGPLQATFTNHRRERSRALPNTAPKPAIERYINARLDLLSAASGTSAAQRQYRRPLAILSVMVGLVLLIACANVANLLTAQAAARAREMALRVSIGAGRGRLLQLLLLQSALLAALATLFGAVFAWWSAPFVVARLNPSDEPVRLALQADWRVLGFCALLTILVTALFGLAPAWRASRVQPMSALKGGDDPHARHRLMNSLVAAQVAFCFLVHFAAGLFISTFDRLSHQPLGFNAEGVLLLETPVKGGTASAETWQQVAEQLRTVPGVHSSAVSSWALLSNNIWGSSIQVGPGAPEDYNPYFLSVSRYWTDVMGIGLLGGRPFRPQDRAAVLGPLPASNRPSSDGVAMVNEEFARHYFKGESPIGKSFLQLDRVNKPVRTEIVGLVRDVRYSDLREPIRAEVFVPFDDSDGGTFVVRAQPGTDPLTLATALRKEVSRVHQEFRVSNITTQSELVRNQTLRERLLAMMSLFFAVVALVLAGVGLYGVLNYSVVQRTREIGIRMALGARPLNIVQRMTAEVFGMLLVGSAIGLLAGIVSEHYVRSLLFEVKATDLNVLATPALALFAAALLAALAPTLRAIRIDPAQALRAD